MARGHTAAGAASPLRHRATWGTTMAGSIGDVTRTAAPAVATRRDGDLAHTRRVPKWRTPALATTEGDQSDKMNGPSRGSAGPPARISDTANDDALAPHWFSPARRSSVATRLASGGCDGTNVASRWARRLPLPDEVSRAAPRRRDRRHHSPSPRNQPKPTGSARVAVVSLAGAAEIVDRLVRARRVEDGPPLETLTADPTTFDTAHPSAASCHVPARAN